jgi:GntR family colanic acid and biofilm gene transcriptional regulator
MDAERDASRRARRADHAPDRAEDAPLLRDSLSAQAYRRIKDRMIAGRLPPGTRLALRDVARELAISVTPLREALLQLVAQRVLTQEHGYSIAVPQLSVAHCRELWEVRLQLEPLCAAAALANATPALADRLSVANDRMLASKQARNVDGGMDYNRDFHFALYAAAGMPTLHWMIECIWAQAGPYVRHFLEHHVRTRNDAALQGPHVHTTIIAALRRNDAAALRRGIRRDLIEIRDGILGLLPEGSG